MICLARVVEVCLNSHPPLTMSTMHPPHSAGRILVQEKLRLFHAKRKFRRAVHTIVALQKLHSSLSPEMKQLAHAPAADGNKEQEYGERQGLQDEEGGVLMTTLMITDSLLGSTAPTALISDAVCGSPCEGAEESHTPSRPASEQSSCPTKREGSDEAVPTGTMWNRGGELDADVLTRKPLLAGPAGPLSDCLCSGSESFQSSGAGLKEDDRRHTFNAGTKKTPTASEAHSGRLTARVVRDGGQHHNMSRCQSRVTAEMSKLGVQEEKLVE